MSLNRINVQRILKGNQDATKQRKQKKKPKEEQSQRKPKKKPAKKINTK